MEEDLFRMFRHMDFGSVKPTDFMAQLLRQYELGILQMLKNMVDTRINEITKAQPQATDDMNPFKILGVSMDATEAEVKAAYKKKAAEAHPDHGGSHEQMVKVNAAFEVIKRFRGWK